MRIHIEHATIYRYQRAVHFDRHRLVLRPREGHDVRVERMHLRLEPEHRLVWTRDVFGNSVAIVDWLQPSDTLTIVNDVQIARTLPFPFTAADRWIAPLPPQYDVMEQAITDVYRLAAFPDSEGPVRQWLKESLTVVPSDAESTMENLCILIHTAIAYQRRMEKGVQTPARTLELRSGSCRDMAALMMDASRLLGVAARFASGYLHGSASLAGRAATHAWTEIYLPLLGWRGFDPTIGSAISLNHIVTGVSNHPRGVMPVSGRFLGSDADFQSMSVNVRTEELPIPNPDTTVDSRQR
jgi:transglutaminase-like putative cysteine protease